MIREELIDYARRKIVTGKLALIFVITVVVLTFFSSTINNFMLPRVRFEKPTSGALVKEISGEGIVAARSTMEEYVETNMKVIDVAVSVGDTVKKDQPIMTLDIEDLKSNLQDETARYEQMKISLSRLKDSGNGVSYDNNIAGVLANKEQQEKNLENIKVLFEAGFESADNLKKAEKTMEEAVRNYDAAVTAKEKFLRDKDRDIKNAELNMEIQGRKVDALKKQIANDGVYTAPADGIITQLNFSKGTMANSSKPLFVLSDISGGYELRIAVDIDLAGFVSPGEEVDVNVVSLGGEKVKGKISKIVDDSQHRGEQKEVVIDLDAEGLAGGERAEVYISKKTKQYFALVPNSSIYSDSDGTYVYVIKEKDGPLGAENYLQRVDVMVEDSDSSKSALVSGIMPMDKVVVQTSKPVSDGAKVVVE